MAYRVVQTELAGQDLEEILCYMAVSLANPLAAASFADEVEDCYTSLENLPFLYEKCRDPRLCAMGYRRAILKNHIMVYRVSEEKQTVYILRFFYGRQEYEKLI